MNIETKTDSIFTDKTNTIPKNPSVKQIFTKQTSKCMELESVQFLGTENSIQRCEENSFKGIFNKNALRSITPTRQGVSKLMLSDEGEVVLQSVNLDSVNADSNDLPDGAFVLSQVIPGNVV